MPGANRITLSGDADSDTVDDLRSVLQKGMNPPFGVALAGADLLAANADAALRMDCPFLP
ncbi:hypothetical protein [Rhodoferax sp.]|uniref:hypothetical protein n=1 Tax=Rhodoferax sp. TaxID=50421 RepID=UPI0025E9D99D|nr:hypothetical protein [Rhodoferax sp.]